MAEENKTINDSPAPKKDYMRSPLFRIIMGIFGVIMLISGISKIMSGTKEMSSGGMPDKKEVAAAAEKSLSSMKEFKEPGGSFSMSYPASWEVAEKVEAPVIFKAALFHGTVNMSVTGEDLPEGTSSKAYADATDEAIKKAIKNDIKKESEVDVDLQGSPARKRIHSLSAESEGKIINVEQTMVLCAKGKKGYCITFSSLQEWFAQFEPVFNKIIESIKIS